MKKAKQVKPPPNPTKGAKPQIGFVLVRDDEVCGWSFSLYRKECVKEVARNFMVPWAQIKGNGYRIIKAMVCPAPTPSTRRARG